MIGAIPHMRIVVAFCAVAVAIYAGFSVYVVAYLKDPALTGDVIGTWKSFAVGAFAFWIGASSGGKAKETGPAPKNAKEAAELVSHAAEDKKDQIVGEGERM